MFKGAIFDLDGVIVDTVPLHFKAWKRIFGEYGRDFSMDDYIEYVDGKPRVEGVRAILTELGEQEIIEAGDRKQSYFLEYLEKEPIVVFEAAVRFVKEFRSKGIKLAAASSSKNATRILKKIDLLDFFDVNVSGGDFERGKPDPEIFLFAALKMGLRPEECVVFEDSSSGVEAAFRGGFFCVGIDSHDRPETMVHANIIVKSLDELSFEELVVVTDDF